MSCSPHAGSLGASATTGSEADHERDVDVMFKTHCRGGGEGTGQHVGSVRMQGENISKDG